jgi:hypothetical protein
MHSRSCLALLAAAALVACDSSTPAASGPPPLQPQVPADATTLAELSSLTGLSPLAAEQLPATVQGFALYESSGHIKGQARGVLRNETGKVITDGELRFEATVQFDDACPRTIHGSKGLRSLKVSESKPWRPGEERAFTIASDEHLAAITGEFPAATVQWRIEAFVEDPICWRARGTVAQLGGNWAAATVGSEASASATVNGKTSLSSAFDGGERMETLEEGTGVTVVGVRGRKLRVKAPSGVEGWASADAFDLLDAGSLWP